MLLHRVRVKIANTALYGSEPFPYDEWDRFILQKIFRPQHEKFTLTSLLCLNKEVEVTTQRINILPYPSIITTTREFEEYDSCTTFDVDFKAKSRSGFVPVRFNGKLLELPSKIIAPALIHTVHSNPLAV